MQKIISFTRDELVNSLEIARESLQDGWFFDRMCRNLDLADAYMTELRAKLHAVMNSNVDLFEQPSLRSQQENVWASHSKYPKEDWIHEVSEGYTHLGYWEWVESKLEQQLNNN